MSEEIIKKVLREFGLTDSESEVYIFLAKHRALKGGDIAKRLEAHRAEVYRSLKSLQGRGMVETTLESPTRFMAVPFERIIDLHVKAKRREAALLESAKKDLLGHWKSISKTRMESPLERFVVIEGDNKIYPKIFQMIENATREIVVVISGSTFIQAAQGGVDKLVLRKAKETGIRGRLLTQATEENLDLMRQSAARVFEGHLEDRIQVRHLETDLRLYTRFIVKDEDEALFFIRTIEGLRVVNREEACLWTNCKAVVNILKVFFEELWLNSTDVAEKIGKLGSTNRPKGETKNSRKSRFHSPRREQ